MYLNELFTWSYIFIYAFMLYAHTKNIEGIAT